MSIPALLSDYSGVVIDQNHATKTSLEVKNNKYYQTFRLPEDYKRGTKLVEENFPGLSGFQLLVTVPSGHADEAEIEWTLEQYIFGSGWSPITKGTTKGCHADGERIWMDVLFDKEVPINVSQIPDPTKPEAPTEFRIGFQIINHISSVWYAKPNPYAFGAAYRADGLTSIVSTKPSWKEESWEERSKNTASFSFRILSLIADSGTDFLGDPYRSVATITSASNAAGENTNSGYWLSNPQPSRFAVVSHYSDLRPFPSTVSYSSINRVENPSFAYDRPGFEPAIWSTEGSYWTVSGAKTKINRWRFQWTPEESYRKYEGVEIEGKTYYSITDNNRNNNPVTDGGANWKETNKWFETIAGVQYLEVNTEGGVSEPVSGHFIQRFSARLFASGSLKGSEEISEGTSPNPGEGVIIRENIPVTIGKPETFSVYIRTVGSSFKARLGFGDARVGAVEKEFTVTDEWVRQEVTLIPTNTGKTTVAVITNGTHTFFVNAAMDNPGAKSDPYFDGDDENCKWESLKGRSGSVKLSEKKPEENEVVIDAVLIDPITPGVAFNIYYSNDLLGNEEGNEPTIEEWEQKLWIHVPQSYVSSIKTTYVLPSPIVAKFIKIEFSQLQARSYNPGDFQKPMIYKRFPDWVSEIFLSLLQSPNFVAKKVGVTYDALELAHNYYLGDLKQVPLSPVAKEPQSGPAVNAVNAETLSKINLLTNTYTKPPGALGNKEELLGHAQSALSLNQENYPTEREPGFQGSPTFPVSQLDRSAIVLDQQMPVMFFPITCRHEYKEVTGEFENKRAYFAGLNEIAFVRYTYTTQSDGELYIETGADDINTERNDFVVEEGIWFTY